MEVTDDEWEFEDDLPSFPEWEFIEEDSEHDDWIWSDFWGEDE